MLDTGFDNPLMASNTGFEDSVTQAEQQAADTYWVITSNAKGGASSPFTGDTAQLVQMTEQELLKEYNDSGQIQDHFGTFENYMTYIGESQEWIQSADWMNASMEYGPTDRKWLYQMNEDVMWRPGEREDLQRQIDYDQAYAKQGEYIGWLNAGAELLEKWGLNDKRVIYNSDGDQFKWTGSGYQKTIKVDDHASFADYASAILKSVVIGTVTGQLVNAAVNAVGAFVNPISGSWGTAGQVLTQVLSGSASATAGGIAYEDAMSVLNNPNVIVNLSDAIDNQGNYEGEDGTVVYSYDNLPAGYIYDEVRNMVINESTGEEYPVNFSPWGGRVWLPADDDGGGGATDGAPASDPNAPTSGGESEGKYVVVGDNGDGTVTVRDTVDGDIWILEGNYEVGDVIPESEMTNARGAGVDPANGSTDTDTETDDGSLPTLLPPFPETETPDNAPADPPPDEVVVDATTDTTTDTPADTAPTETASSVDALCAMPRPEQYGFGQIAWDKYCGGQSTDGTTGDNDGSDASGDSGTGDGTGNGDGSGDGDGTGDGNGDGNGPSNANQWVDGGGASKATWTQLFPGTQFKPRRDFTKGMLSSRTPQTNFSLDDYSKQRMGLLSSAFKDLA